MNFKPFDRLLSSKDILSKCEKNEATYRSVIHQSYYASFNQLTNEIENRLFYYVDEDTKEKSVHKAYSDACLNKLDSLNQDHSDFAKLNAIISDFKRLKGLRRLSDYELIKVINKTEADLSILLSSRIFDSLEELS